MRGGRLLRNVRTRRIFVGLWVLGGLGFGASAAANSLSVVPRSDLRGSFDLELRLDDARKVPATEAWIGFGPERGLVAERWLVGRIGVDASRLKLAALGSVNRLHFLRLRSRATAVGGMRLFLERADARWWIGAEVWDPIGERFVLVGRAPLTADERDDALLEFEWRGASAPGAGDGALQLRRVEGDESVTLLFSRVGVRDGFEGISLVQLGLSDTALQPTAGHGRLALDNFSLHRGGGPENP